MKRRFLTRLALILGALAVVGVATTASAHHSYAMFDREHEVSFKGVVRKLEWTNPHVYFLVEAPDPKGVVHAYTIEAASVNKMVRAGWKANTVKVGETVTFTIYPFRDGKPGGMLVSITQENGTVHKA